MKPNSDRLRWFHMQLHEVGIMKPNSDRLRWFHMQLCEVGI